MSLGTLGQDPLCAQCRKPRVLNEWPRGFCRIECERAFYEALGDRVPDEIINRFRKT